MSQDNAARQQLIEALGACLPVGSWTLDAQPAGVTILMLLPAATEELTRQLSGRPDNPAPATD